MIADFASDITAAGIALSAVLSGIAAVIGAMNRRAIRTPSGDPIGQVTERTHDLAATSVKQTYDLNGTSEHEISDPPPAERRDEGQQA